MKEDKFMFRNPRRNLISAVAMSTLLFLSVLINSESKLFLLNVNKLMGAFFQNDNLRVGLPTANLLMLSSSNPEKSKQTRVQENFKLLSSPGPKTLSPKPKNPKRGLGLTLKSQKKD